MIKKVLIPKKTWRTWLHGKCKWSWVWMNSFGVNHTKRMLIRNIVNKHYLMKSDFMKTNHGNYETSHELVLLPNSLWSQNDFCNGLVWGNMMQYTVCIVLKSLPTIHRWKVTIKHRYMCVCMHEFFLIGIQVAATSTIEFYG